jgi:DNA-binding MarR family transcriptional regulator
MDALRVAGRRHSDATVIFHDTIAQRLGLHGTDEKTMSLLERVGPMSASEIAKRTGLAPASVTNLIDRLEQKGLVRRTRDTNDRRTVIVEPTEDGVAKFVPFFAATRSAVARMWARYDEKELAVILDFLERNAERLIQETSKLTSQSTSETRDPKPRR